MPEIGHEKLLWEFPVRTHGGEQSDKIVVVAQTAPIHLSSGRNSGKARTSYMTMSAILTSRSAVPPLARIMLATAIGLPPGRDHVVIGLFAVHYGRGFQLRKYTAPSKLVSCWGVPPVAGTTNNCE